MKKSEREILFRLHDVMDVPGCRGGGTQSASLSGHLSYSNDMNFLMPKVRRLLVLIANPAAQAYEGEIEEDLVVLEEWHARRKIEDWKQ